MGMVETLARRRMMNDPICIPPYFFLSMNSTPISATQIEDGDIAPAAQIYLFAASENIDATLNFKVVTYNSSGTITDTVTNTLINLSSNFNNPSLLRRQQFIIPTGGHLEISGYCEKTGAGDSLTRRVGVYLATPKLELDIVPDSGTYAYYVDPFYAMISNASYDDGEIHYTVATSQTTTLPTAPADPTVSDPIFPGKAIVTATSVYKFKAFSKNSNFTDSDVYTRNYVITKDTLQPPVITVPSGDVAGLPQITITNPNTVGTIYYTLDNTTPTTDSQWYYAPVTVAGTGTIKAKVILDLSYATPSAYYESTTASENYNFLGLANLVTSVESITGDSAILKGVLTYDYDFYVSRMSSQFGETQETKRPIVGFSIPGYDSENNDYVYCDNIDMSGNNNTVISQETYSGVTYNIATKTFRQEISLDKFSNSANIQATAVAKLYFYNGQTIINVVPRSGVYDGYEGIDMNTVTGNTVTFTKKLSRRPYSILAENSDGYNITGWPTETDFVNHMYDPWKYTVKAILSPKNVSFFSDWQLNRWGQYRYQEERYVARNWNGVNTAEHHQYNTIMSLVRDPWTVINNTTGQNSGSECDEKLKSLIQCEFSNQTGNRDTIRDLFGWGTSGSHLSQNQPMYMPWSTSQTDSDYYAYDAATADIRNVRSSFLQDEPDEPNTPFSSSFIVWMPPRMWSDWGTILADRVNMYSNNLHLYWDICQQSTQDGNLTYDSRAFGMINDTNKTSLCSRIATLSKDEWYYMLFTRPGNRFAKGCIYVDNISNYGYYHTTASHSGQQVSVVPGLFIFSDNWTSSNTTTFLNINDATGTFASGTIIPESMWNDPTKDFENSITFLPVTGYRNGTSIVNPGDGWGYQYGYYWSSTSYPSDSTKAWALHFDNTTVEMVGVPKSRGCAVRLAQYVYDPWEPR